ncbi:hypothetical protein [Pseudonocardia sp. NPDC046786]|uniref:hypothetical protein n=1 Tax=Pseudonocardia sp. NPDC046786 TaxID=3155471 RepID=UPI0033E7DB3D
MNDGVNNGVGLGMTGSGMDSSGMDGSGMDSSGMDGSGMDTVMNGGTGPGMTSGDLGGVNTGRTGCAGPVHGGRPWLGRAVPPDRSDRDDDVIPAMAGRGSQSPAGGPVEDVRGGSAGRPGGRPRARAGAAAGPFGGALRCPRERCRGRSAP